VLNQCVQVGREIIYLYYMAGETCKQLLRTQEVIYKVLSEDDMQLIETSIGAHLDDLAKLQNHLQAGESVVDSVDALIADAVQFVMGQLQVQLCVC
jgi:predicted GNAT family acetyltransferase